MGISLTYIFSFEPLTIGKQQYVILIRLVPALFKRYALAQHNGLPPQTYAEKQEFKSVLNAQKRTPDEENFDEAVAQAYRAWTPTVAPPHLVELFADADTTTSSPPFGHLIAALHSFTERPPHVLPLSATLPDMKSDTESYVRLQNLYRTQAAEDRESFRSLLRVPIETELVDLFVKNAHGVQLLKGARYGALDAAPEKLSGSNAPSLVIQAAAVEII
jgi:amyloid beta precursor protein binding protein 1